jgi:hypothetical protein
MRFYKIKKGDHYCSMSIFEKIGALGWKVKTMEVKFLFRSECWWAPPRNNDDLDQNKLAGIGFGMNHHKNSVRFTWVPDFDKPNVIKIYGYTYDEKKSDPKFTYAYITSVNVLQPCQGKIESIGNQYRLTVNGTVITMDNTNSDPGLCFRLFPYFGGNNTAPHDMTIELEF